MAPIGPLKWISCYNHYKTKDNVAPSFDSDESNLSEGGGLLVFKLFWRQKTKENAEKNYRRTVLFLA